MLIDFFFTLKDAKIPVTIKEFLTLLEAMERGVTSPSMDDFYYLSRLTMVKDEANFDKFDRAFAAVFQGHQRRLRHQFARFRSTGCSSAWSASSRPNRRRRWKNSATTS
jgi:uncharacterized protein with von Willebrand factor type A (vWA) domain